MSLIEARVCILRQWRSRPALNAANGQSVHGLPLPHAVEEALSGEPSRQIAARRSSRGRIWSTHVSVPAPTDRTRPVDRLGPHGRPVNYRSPAPQTPAQARAHPTEKSPPGAEPSRRVPSRGRAFRARALQASALQGRALQKRALQASALQGQFGQSGPACWPGLTELARKRVTSNATLRPTPRPRSSPRIGHRQNRTYRE